jgi:4-alpha-glucanotransferase
LLISLQALLEDGLLLPQDVEGIPRFPEGTVDFGAVIPAKMAVLRRAFQRSKDLGKRENLDTFRVAHRAWVDDFALFMALKDANSGAPWNEWEASLRRRDPDAIEVAHDQYADDIDFHVFLQAVFASQWEFLRKSAHERGIQIVGDIPIFVAYDSADVWARQDLFRLTAEGEPEVVAGVPPDYFSSTGQLWGNPHYRWDVMEARGFAWWIDRFRRLLDLVDVVRLDHFRGFAASWEIPYGSPTAEHGAWVRAPGPALFSALESALGTVPIIAENLGVITPDVEEMRERFGYPGMYILEFAFGSGPSNPSLPHNIERESVLYTGTHDNDTVLGWWESISPDEKAFVRLYLGASNGGISWDMIRAAYASVADLAIVPLQDVLGLGTEARLNYPGRPEGNWTWRAPADAMSPPQAAHLREIISAFGRLRPADSSPALPGSLRAS